MAIVVFLAVALVGAWMSGYGPGLRYRGIALTGLAIIMIGAVLLRWNDMPWNASTRGASVKASPRHGPNPANGAVHRLRCRRPSRGRASAHRWAGTSLPRPSLRSACLHSWPTCPGSHAGRNLGNQSSVRRGS